MKNPFSGLFRARDKPQDSVSAAPTFYFGTSGSGKPVNANTAVPVFLSFVHSQRQAGDCFRDDPDTSVDCGKLDRCVCVDRFPGAAGAEVECWRGANAAPGLIPRPEQGGEWVLHEGFILSLSNMQMRENG